MIKRNPHREKIKRRPPNAAEKIGACLIKMGLVDYEDAKKMTAEQICSLVQWDHAALHAFDGSNHPTNLTPRLILEHREKSKTDAKIVAKNDRLQPKHIAFQSKLLAKAGQEVCPVHTPKPKRKTKWPSQKMQSKPFPKRDRPKSGWRG